MNKERLMKVILAPHISEKTSMAADKSRQYAFHVVNDATKPEIRQAVELLFDVKVDSVQVRRRPTYLCDQVLISTLWDPSKNF